MPHSSQIQEGYAYLRIRGARAAIEFYKQAFGAEEVFCLAEPNGRVAHAELMFGPTKIMLSDEYPERGILSPQAYGGTGASVHLHVSDVDAVTKQAAEVGATVLMEPTDQFYGERVAKLVDPYGHDWMLGQQIEQVSHEEIQRRFSEMCGGSTS